MAIRITCLIKRKPGMTAEEFHEYWSVNHGRLFSSLKAVKEKLVRYNQFHVLAPASDAMAAAGVPIAQFDGAAEFWVEKVEDLLALFGDAEYQEKAVPDELNFLDRVSVQMLIGEDQLKYEKA